MSLSTEYSSFSLPSPTLPLLPPNKSISVPLIIVYFKHLCILIWPLPNIKSSGGCGSHYLLSRHLLLVQMFIKYALFISWQLDIFCMDYRTSIIHHQWKPIFNLEPWWYNTNSHCISLWYNNIVFEVPLKNKSGLIELYIVFNRIWNWDISLVVNMALGSAVFTRHGHLRLQDFIAVPVFSIQDTRRQAASSREVWAAAAAEEVEGAKQEHRGFSGWRRDRESLCVASLKPKPSLNQLLHWAFNGCSVISLFSSNLFIQQVRWEKGIFMSALYRCWGLIELTWFSIKFGVWP